MKNAVRPFADQGHYTQFHNLILDYLMPILSANAFKILCLIVRKTKGHGKRSDVIAYSQIKTGTGIKSDATIAKGLTELLGIGCILKREGAIRSEATAYALNRQFKIERADLTEEIEEGLTSKNEVTKGENLTSKNEASVTSKNEARKPPLTSKNEAVLLQKMKSTKETKKVCTHSNINTLSQYPENEADETQKASASDLDFSSLLQLPTAQAVISICKVQEQLLTTRKAEAIIEVAARLDEAGLTSDLPIFGQRWAQSYRALKNNNRPPQPHEILEAWGEVMTLNATSPNIKKSSAGGKFDARDLHRGK